MVMDPGTAPANNLRSAIAATAQLLNQGQLEEAAHQAASLLRRQPNNPEICFLFASILARQGKLDEATTHMESASKFTPGNPKILNALSTLYDKTRRYDDASASYQKLISLLPDGADKLQVTMRRGVSLAKGEHHEEAEEVFRYVNRQAPEYAPAWHNLGNTLVKQLRREEAVGAFKQALKFDPHNAYINYGLGRSLIWIGQHTESIDYLTTAIALAPYELQIMSYKILALRHAGRIEEANDLEGIHDMVLSVEVPHPPEYGSLAEWNDVLREEITGHSALTKEFKNRATRNGAKVDHMFAANKTPIFEQFERQIRTSFEEVLLRMPKKEGHPLPLSVDGGYFADMWSNVMYDGGHQIAHNHPKGWFSACYYNQLPDCVSSGGDEHEGWIEFGGTAYDFPEPKVTTKRQIQPEAGLMVVFPSYVFHRTIPFHSDQERISCAFDAKPLGWKRS